MSLYLKLNRSEYYDLLQAVSFQGAWEEWVLFFVRGVTATAERANALAKNILRLFDQDEASLKSLGARRGSALQVLGQMRETPYTSPRRLEEKTGLSFNTVVSALEALTGMGILQEMPSRKGRLFLYTQYIRMMDEGAAAD